MNKFNIIEEPMNDLKLLKTIPMIDERGYFERMLCTDEFKEIGLTKPIVNINHSLTKEKGTIRGMHYQCKPKTETKIIKCIKGSILDVVIDIRENSPTFLHNYTIELNHSNDLMLYIPEGFAHGFQSLEDNTEIIYFVTNSYSQELESGLNPFDNKLSIKWPLECSFISNKDKLSPFIDNNFSGIKGYF